MTATTDLVLRLLVELAPEIDPAGVDLDRELRDQVDLDSMDFLNVLVAIAEQLRVEIPERDYAKVRTLDALVAYVEAARAAPA